MGSYSDHVTIMLMTAPSCVRQCIAVCLLAITAFPTRLRIASSS